MECPVCSSPRATALEFESRQGDWRFEILECAACAHRYVGTPPDNATLARLYDEYYAADRRQGKPARTGWRDRALARTLVPRLPRDARILEIGCNFGETLLAFPGSYRLEGIDLSASAARAAAANPRLEVRQGFFEEADFPQAAYDCVIALAVIEHIREPVAFLRKAAGVLKPGGTLVLMTGDYGSWHARRKGEAWSLYHAVGHLHFFSQESLGRALVRAGLAPDAWLWAGPTPLTSRLPGPLARALHCQTTSLLLPGFQARRRLGSNLYSWSVKAAAPAGARPDAQAAAAAVPARG
jgi:SAM-dependent methyltransferase